MPRLIVLPFAFSAVWAAGCSSASQAVTSPSPLKCTVSITATPTSFQAGGGPGTLSITTNRECEWSATAANGWIQLGDSTTGQGNATLSFTVARTADPSARKGTITVGSQQVDLIQDAAQCVIPITPPAGVIGENGGPGTHTVTASSPQCTWTARSDIDWMSIVDGAQGSGNGQVRYNALRNTGPARNGTLTIAGQAVVITQPSGCGYTLQPGSGDIGASGGAGRVTVNTSTGCTWTAASTAPWVTLTDAKGTGTGAFGFSVPANTMGVPARSGSITVADQTFRVNQAAGPACTYSLNVNVQSFAAAGGPSSFSVTTVAACQWTAQPSAPWIAITASAKGAGNGTVNFTVAPNALGSPPRAGTISVGGLSFTVFQLGM